MSVLDLTAHARQVRDLSVACATNVPIELTPAD